MLLELAVKSSLVIAAALVTVAAMRHWSAAAKHVVLASAFVATLALPAIVVVGPHWHVPSWSVSTTPKRRAPSLPVDVQRPPTPNDGSGGQMFRNRADTSNVLSGWAAHDWLRVLTIIWLIGIVISAIRLCAGIASAALLAREAEPLTNADWIDSLTSIASSMRVADRVALRTSAKASVPLAWRLGPTSTLILPVAAEHWQADTRRAVLLHECGHLERHDCAVRSLATLACGLWWFNPLAHLALRKLRSEQERACDDVVLGAGISPADYAHQLFDMAHRAVMATSQAGPIVAMVRRSELEDRMFALIDRSRQRNALSPHVRLIAIALVSTVITAVGALRLSAARSAFFSPTVRPLQAGPGGPVFEWTRAVDEEVRQRVASALEAAASRDSEAQVREVADRALQTIRAMPEGTVSVSSPCRGTCVSGVPALPTPASVVFEMETKMALLELDSHVDATRRQAVRRLPARYESAVEVLAELLRDPDPHVRRFAAIRLDSVMFPPAVPGWVSLLVDEDDSLRERAAISLGAIGDPAAIDALTSVLLNDANPDVRRQAARSLGLIAAGG